MTPETHIFRLPAANYKKTRKKLILYFSCIALLFAVIIITALLKSENTETSLFTAGLPLLIFIGILAFGFFRLLKKQKNSYDSFQLTFTHDQIVREQAYMPTLSFSHLEVMEIVKLTSGLIIIKGTDNSKFIYIPSTIENKEQLEALLATVRPITSSSKKTLVRKNTLLYYLLLLGILVLILVSNFSNDSRTVQQIIGPLSLVAIIWNIVGIQLNPDIDRRIKRRSLIIVLVIAFIVATTYFDIFSLLQH